METITQNKRGRPRGTEIRNRVVILLPVIVDRAMEIEAAAQGTSKRNIVEKALRQYLGMEQ